MNGILLGIVRLQRGNKIKDVMKIHFVLSSETVATYMGLTGKNETNNGMTITQSNHG